MTETSPKVVILAGGKGTRLAEETDDFIPKPMVTIGGIPILQHIIEIYSLQGCSRFIIAGGHLQEEIAAWLKSKPLQGDKNVVLVDTGEETQTGGRLKQLSSFLDEDEDFYMTYGDGLGNVNIRNLLGHHRISRIQENALVTLTAVRPPARFGALQIERGLVTLFSEKRQLDTEFVNGGFYVINSDVLEFIEDDNTKFEFDTLPILSSHHKLGGYPHTGYWQMMDTPRDRRTLEDDFERGKPWLTGIGR